VDTNARLSPISHSLSSFFSRWKIFTENDAALSWEVKQICPMPPWETEGKKMSVPVHPTPSTSNIQMRETHEDHVGLVSSSKARNWQVAKTNLEP